RFGVFAGVVVEALRGDSQRDRFETSNVRFVAEAVGLESLRNVTAFEDPHMRRRSGRLVRMNSEFMAITTRFNALHQLLERLRARGPLQIVSAIEPGLGTLAELLQPYVGRALTDADALRLALELGTYKEGLQAQVRGLRAEYLQTNPSESDLLDFHTAFELLYRFVDEMYSYAETHASLAVHKHEREQWDEPYVAQTSWLVSLAAGVRASAVLLLLGSYWLLSDWPSGASLRGYVQKVIDESLGQPGLTPANLAERLSISVRHLYRLFEEEGDSVCRYIQRSRLKRSADDLSNPFLKRESITSIAYKWGFTDSAHFSRAFKKHFEQSPKDFRAMALMPGR
ncbi:MAG: FUSC family protein, partial [Pseudomonas sp.]|nr:FUSC family protein [Pseudomonas sp.]